MGLRLQGLIWILLLSLGLGGLGMALLTRHLAQSFEALEQHQLAADVRRLQAGLGLVVLTRQRTTREWGQWTDLRDYLLKPSEGFRARQLTPAAVQASGFDWLLLLRPDGTPLDAVAADGSEFPANALLNRASPRGQRLLKMPPAGGICQLDRWQARLLVICQQPVLDTEARGTPVGILVTGEQLGDDKLGHLRRLLGYDFSLAAGDLLPEGRALPGLDGVLTSTELEWIRVHWLLRVGDEAPHSLLRMDWPRELRAQRERTLAGGQAVLIGVALLLAITVGLLIDWRLVRRLTRLQRHLAALRTHERWHERLPVEGSDEVSALAGEANHLLGRIDEQMAELAAQSRTDVLTGLANRRGFEERLQAALERARRSHQPLALLLLDVDHFKQFNDRHGHAAGDRALQLLAQGLREQGARRAGTDLAARWGGEEFALLLENTPLDVAVARYAALRDWLHAQPPGQALAEALRASAGLVLARRDESATELLQRADAALYRAKANGRDRLEFA